MAGPFFVDFDNGNDSNDGEGIGAGNAWATLDKPYTTISAGETCFVRANMSWTPTADHAPANDGTATNPIAIIGADSVTNDPWSDGSDVLPLIDYAEGAYQAFFLSDDFWSLERLHFKNSHSTSGVIRTQASYGLVLKACKFEDNFRWSLRLDRCSLLLQDCTFVNNGDENAAYGPILAIASIVHVCNCTFAPNSTDRIIANLTGGSRFVFEKCAFAQSASSIIVGNDALAIARNCTFTNPGILVSTAPMRASEFEIKGQLQSQVLIDGTDMDLGTIVKGYPWLFQYPGEIDGNASYARSGGGVKGWRFQAGANCNANAPLVLTYFINVDDTNSHDYSMFCKFQANAFDKGADLDETEIFFTITELKADGTIVQTTMGATTWDFDNLSTWQEGAATAFSASSAGELRIDVFVTSPGGDVYIDTPVGEAGAGNEGYADGGLLYNLANVGGGGGGVVPLVGPRGLVG